MYITRHQLCFFILNTNALERANQVGNTLLKGNPLDAEQLVGRGGVNPEHALGPWQLAALDIGARQGIPSLGEVLRHDGGHLPVIEAPADDEEAPAARGRLVHRLDVRRRDVAHVHPQRHGARGGDLLFPLPLQQGHDALVGGVDGLGGGEVVRDRPEHERRVHRDQVEAGPLPLDKVPRRALGQRLGDAVPDNLVGQGVSGGVGVPRLLRVQGAVVKGLVAVEDGGKGRGDDDAADAGGVGRDGAQDADGAVDGRVEELRLGVGEVVVEGRCGVDDGGEGRAVLAENVVKGGRVGNVADGDGEESARGDKGWVVGGEECVGLGLGAHRGDDAVALGEELFENVGSDEAGAT